MKIDTNSSKTIESPRTHFRAEAMARTISRQVSTAAMKRPCSVVMARASQVDSVAAGQADHVTERSAHAT